MKSKRILSCGSLASFCGLPFHFTLTSSTVSWQSTGSWHRAFAVAAPFASSILHFPSAFTQKHLPSLAHPQGQPAPIDSCSFPWMIFLPLPNTYVYLYFYLYTHIFCPHLPASSSIKTPDISFLNRTNTCVNDWTPHMDRCMRLSIYLFYGSLHTSFCQDLRKWRQLCCI